MLQTPPQKACYRSARHDTQPGKPRGMGGCGTHSQGKECEQRQGCQWNANQVVHFWLISVGMLGEWGKEKDTKHC